MTHKSFAISLARQAGKIIKENFALGMKKEWKKDGTPLTATDTAINDIVEEKVKKHYPTHGLLAEEGGNTNEQAEYVWVCDPVDGTIPFSHGIPTCVFSIALVQNGVPILGVVLDPFLDRLYTAETGQGAWLNDKPIHVSSTSDITNSLTGPIAWRSAKYDLSALPEKMIKIGSFPLNVGSTIYLGGLVACGEMLAIAWAGHTPWDAASMKIIVEEAGGKVTDLDGNEQRYDRDIKGYVATNGLVHDKIIELINTK